MCLGIPGKILSITQRDSLIRLGRVSFGGMEKEIHLTYVPEAEVGDYVIVHAGFALTTIDEQEALKVFEYVKEKI